MKKTVKKKIIQNKRLKKRKIRKSIFLIVLVSVILILILIFKFSISPNTFQQKESKLNLFIQSPQNKTYYTKNVQLAVRSTEMTEWMANSIDSDSNITECGNCTSYIRYDLTFENGVHTISVYASDNEGRVAMATVTFTVKT